VDQKAFTLTEILAVLVVLSLLLLLVAPTIINGVRNKEGQVDETQKRILYQAASEYIDANKDVYPVNDEDSYCILVQSLIDEGFVNDNIKSATSDEALSDKKIKADVAGKSINYELVDSCSDVNSNNIKITVEPNNNVWSTKKQVTIDFPNVSNGKFEYKKDGDEWQDYTGKVDFDSNGKIFARVLVSGEEKYSKTSNVSKIDKNPPTCDFDLTGKNGNNEWYVGDVKITANSKDDKGSDEEKSGISRSGVSMTSDATYDVDSLTLAKDGEYTYYCYAKDKAGNVGKNSTVVKRDTAGPIVSDVTSELVGNVIKVTAKVEDKISGIDSISYQFNNGDVLSDWDSYDVDSGVVTKSITATGNLKIIAKDKAGNITEFSHSVVDAAKPSCNISCSGSTGNNGWYVGNVTCNLSFSDENISEYGLSTTDNSYNGIKQVVRKDDTKSLNYYGVVKKTNGVTGKCSITIKKDSTAPSKAKGGSVSKGKVSAVTYSDSTSGVSGSTKYKFQETKSKPAANNITSSSTSGTTTCGKKIYVYSKGEDKAGNTSVNYLGSYSTDDCKIYRYACNSVGYGYNCIHAVAGKYDCSYRIKESSKMEVTKELDNQYKVKIVDYDTKKSKNGFIWKKCTATTKGKVCSNCPG
jgi:prepilin-type N-terminal cleavage/methylation domain-containing protein